MIFGGFVPRHRPGWRYTIHLGAIFIMTFVPVCRSPAADTPSTNSTAQTAPNTPETAQDLISKSTQHMADGKLDDAVGEATRAIQLDPQNPSAYELRGSIYMEKKIWDQAERDYAKADQLSPDPAYKYKLAEIPFLQKNYGDARTRFAKLQQDPGLGDLATHQVFLCDLLAGQEFTAAKELAVMDQGAKTAPYYFSHLAWELYHHHKEEADKYLATAQKLFDQSTKNLYLSNLVATESFSPSVATFTTKDGKRFENATVSIDINGLRVSTPTGWVTLPIEQWPDDISGFPEDFRDLISSARDMTAGNLDQAVSEATMAIQFDSQNQSAYEFRGSIYVQKKIWDSAERDFTKANQIGHDPICEYKLGEIKYLQKSFGDARFRFTQLLKDPQLGDVASYKVFLCDLLGGHESIAVQDLADIDRGVKTPAHYFGHFAWASFHRDSNAIFYLNSAEKLFDKPTFNLYYMSLTDLRGFQPTVATFSTKDGKKFEKAAVFLEGRELRVSTQQGWITLPLDQLPDDLSGFPADIKDLIIKKRASLPTAEIPVSLISFTSKSGKTYDHARWVLNETGLAVLSPDGWVRVPFDQLPADLSSFPPTLQQAVLDKRKAGLANPASDNAVTFTTRQGKQYNLVRVALANNGLRVMSQVGWIEVPFDQLPVDLSPFPPTLQQAILDKRKATDSASIIEAVISFTTKSGKQYNQVRSSLTDTGLRILSEVGWIEIPFEQLPADLTPFPIDWRTKIRSALQSGPRSSPGLNLVSFTTKNGKHYDQARAAMEKNGLRLLTADGLIAVPFDQLPDDVSVFPEEWREQITTKKKKIDNPVEPLNR